MKTTDNQNELFDVVDREDNVVGQTTRKDVHTDKKLIHRSVGAVIFNSKGDLLLQKRSATKDTDPGKWTISCSGHVLSGVGYEDTIVRELKEELGIVCKLEFISKYLCEEEKETEINSLYKGVWDGPFMFHPQEIERGEFYSKLQLSSLIRNKKIDLSYMGLISLRKIGWA